jgi:hypothetical protein
MMNKNWRPPFHMEDRSDNSRNSGKPPGLGSSYRPISLLSLSIKIFEMLLLPFFSSILSPSPTQHGFIPFRSTTSALLHLATRVANGFNDPKPLTSMTVVAIDMSKAFDEVNHTLLLEQFSNSHLHSNNVRWMVSHNRGHSASCLFRGVKSCSRKIPQGSILSPSIFNFFISTCPEPAALLQSYADDFTIMESSADSKVLGVSLTVGLSQISAQAKDKDLVIDRGNFLYP